MKSMSKACVGEFMTYLKSRIERHNRKMIGAMARHRVLIKTGGKETFLKLDEIERLEAAGNYVHIHTNGNRYFLRATLAKLEEKLPGDRFVRVHRSNIVNLDQVKEIIPTPSGDARIVMNSGAHTGMSRRYRDRLKPLEI